MNTIIINSKIKALALMFCRKYVANFVVNMKNVVFIYMNNALKYTITNKIRINLKEIEKLKSSFLEAVFCPKWKLPFDTGRA